ncbi:uncharacterized protein LOC143915161 [Arctopsyche grandis]|uniref:uncharacterized protein LOC143915161 n=1 Tax=Arctopsyche grandis TaxID=121162 RepID=UPI00406D7394
MIYDDDVTLFFHINIHVYTTWRHLSIVSADRTSPLVILKSALKNPVDMQLFGKLGVFLAFVVIAIIPFVNSHCIPPCNYASSSSSSSGNGQSSSWSSSTDDKGATSVSSSNSKDGGAPKTYTYTTGDGKATAAATNDRSCSLSKSSSNGDKAPVTQVKATGSGVAVADAVNKKGAISHSEVSPKRTCGTIPKVSPTAKPTPAATPKPTLAPTCKKSKCIPCGDIFNKKFSVKPTPAPKPKPTAAATPKPKSKCIPCGNMLYKEKPKAPKKRRCSRKPKRNNYWCDCAACKYSPTPRHRCPYA